MRYVLGTWLKDTWHSEQARPQEYIRFLDEWSELFRMVDDDEETFGVTLEIGDALPDLYQLRASVDGARAALDSEHITRKHWENYLWICGVFRHIHGVELQQVTLVDTATAAGHFVKNVTGQAE